jgi:hypothetical protein
MFDLSDDLFEDECDIRFCLSYDLLPSDDYYNYEIRIAETSRVVLKRLNHQNSDESILLDEILDESKVQEIKKLIGNIKLPIITNETEQFWCDGSSFTIHIVTNDFDFEARWSDEEDQEAYKPLKALADLVCSIGNTED